MPSLKILSKSEVQNITQKLHAQFGVSKIPGILVMRGEERIFLFTGNLNEKEILELDENIPVERVGIYFAKVENEEVRLSIEGTQILSNQITKNIFNLDEKQAEQWMTGQELLVKSPTKGVLIIKYKNNFLGCGKASENKIGNFVPKSRRLKLKA